MELFLTESEKAKFAKWQPKRDDRSISKKVLDPLWNIVVRQVPSNVAPNVLSLAGLMCLIHAYYLCLLYMDLHPRSVSILAVILAFAYQTLNAIDGKHARITRNSSPVGELFDYVCDNIGSVFLMLTLCYIVGIRDPQVQWYVVQTAQLVFLQKHISAFTTGTLRFSALTGPGEFFFVFFVVGIIRAVVGLQWAIEIFDRIGATDIDLKTAISSAYYGMYAYSFLRIILLPRNHSSTRNGLVFCLIYRALPALAMNFALVKDQPATEFHVICDGVFMSVICSDIILAKMASRELHPWVVLFAMLSVFHNLATVSLCLFYYVAVFTDVCHYMKLPMFSIHRNVYVSGVFDLCHVGHMRLFENALKFGTRLYVGVCNDEDCTTYKRKPIMTMKERAEAVAACKFVHEVIPNAPCFDLPVEFLLKHNVHVVGLSEEYDRPDDPFYAGARELGIARVLPRTEGMSTSELIRRIKEYSKEGEGSSSGKQN